MELPFPKVFEISNFLLNVLYQGSISSILLRLEYYFLLKQKTFPQDVVHHIFQNKVSFKLCTYSINVQPNTIINPGAQGRTSI